MNRRGYLAGLAGASIATFIGYTALGDPDGALLGSTEYDIGMSRNAFEPTRYETTVGEPVVWKNTSEAYHTVTAYESAIFDEEGATYFATGGYNDEETARAAYWDRMGGSLATRETYEHTFEVPGTYSYFCVPHEIDGNGDVKMVGSVVVEESE